MGNLDDKFEALLRGGAQGATAGWGDEGVAALLSKLPMPKDPEGIPREYAAGSAEQDYRNTERGANAESERRFPGTYHAGKALGAAPALVAGGAGGGLAGAGLVGGLRGGIAGAGNAEEGNRLQGAARLAGPEALMSMAGAAAPQALGKMKDLFGNLPPPPGGLAPAYAGAGASMGGAAVEEGLPLINMMSTMPAKGGPRGGRGASTPDERIIRQDQDEWAVRNPEAARQEPNVGRPAIPPTAPTEPEAAFVPDIPKATKAWPTSLDKAFDEVNMVEKAGAKEAAAREKVFQQLEKGRANGDFPPLQNLNDPRQNIQMLRDDPTWQEMNQQISKQNNPPAGSVRPFQIPKQDKLPNLEKEYDAANAEYDLNDKFDQLKKRPKQANAGDNIRALLGKL